MILGIDATNILDGGGVTHLAEILKIAQPERVGFEQVIVWSSRSTLSKIEDRYWLKKCHVPTLDGNLANRLFWKIFNLDSLLKKNNCDILFVPGGSYSGNSKKMVAMSQNLLPFDINEVRRYGFSIRMIRFLILRISQGNTFCNANGVIFLTNYARETILKQLPPISGSIATIPHGVNSDFFCPPRHQREISDYNDQNPYRLLYVSRIDVYKHQWFVVQAAALLKEKGLPIQLNLVGGHYHFPALKRLRDNINKYDPKGDFIHYHGSIPYSKMSCFYHQADLAIFASSCENLPNILLECMAAGLPIACSNRGSMPDVLGTSGIYFDPEDPNQIANALFNLIHDPQLRNSLSCEAYRVAQTFTWEKCASQTFNFLAKIAKS